jgi:hypothetical protein
MFAGIIATVLGMALMPTPADAAKTPAHRAALKEATLACKAEAKKNKIKWTASRKFVSTCVAKSVKHYAVNTEQLRRELDIAGLHSFTLLETGCLQNVYCDVEP